MKLFLINPSRDSNKKGDFWDFKFEKRILGQTALMPLFLPTIAAATPKDFEIQIIDEKIEEINFDDKVDIVGIGAMTSTINRAYEISDEYRKRGVKVAIGGIHASMMYEEAAQHADSVIIGEADFLWREAMEDFKNGGLKKYYSYSEYPNIEEIPTPRNDLIKTERYVINQVQTTRGCPFDCDFCSVKAFSGNQYRVKKIEQTIKEIQSLSPTYDINIFGHKLKSPKTLLFADDNLIGNKAYAKKFLEAITPLKLEDWYCQSSINLGRDREMISMMKQAGCHSVIIGIESVMPETIQSMDKKINKVEDYSECIANIQSAGIKVMPSFVVGSDTEDESIFEKTATFIKDNNLVYPMINILTPLPGTKLYTRMENEGRILHKNWTKYDFESVCFKPKNMSAKTLEDGRRWIFREIFSLDNIQKRYDNFMTKKEANEVTGFEDAFGKMKMTDKFFMALLVLKILSKVNPEQRKYFIEVIKKFLKGKETNFGNSFSIMSFNDYAYNIPISESSF